MTTSKQFFRAKYLAGFANGVYVRKDCREWYVIGNLWREFYLSAGESDENGQTFTLSEKGRAGRRECEKLRT